jgi:hypothetical protein
MSDLKGGLDYNMGLHTPEAEAYRSRLLSNAAGALDALRGMQANSIARSEFESERRKAQEEERRFRLTDEYLEEKARTSMDLGERIRIREHLNLVRCSLQPKERMTLKNDDPFGLEKE